jgi:hypothetical protein
MSELSNYPCSAASLYGVITLVLNSLLENLADFANHKGKYTQAFVTIAFQKMNAAKHMPDRQIRGSASTVSKGLVKSQVKNMLKTHRALNLYIKEAWTDDAAAYVPRLVAAGKNHLAQAKNCNWDSFDTLTTDGENFILANEAVLLTTGNMPLNFKDKYILQKKECLEKIALFLGKRQSNTTLTAEKVKANNAIYNDTIRICLDGQYLFNKNDALWQQFSFTHVLTIQSGNIHADVNQTVTLPVINANAIEPQSP